MDRPTTAAAAAAAQAASSNTVRGLPENPAQGRRMGPNGSLSNITAIVAPPVPPVPTGSSAPVNGSLSASRALTAAQVVGLAKEAMKTALESEGQAADASTAGMGLKSGVTIDLSRKNIQRLPEEVVDIVKGQLERLALSHNQLSTLPLRFSECTSLRYLNIRGNQIKEFPMTLCDLTSLEILDLGRNQLRVLPDDIAKLTSLKVLSVPKNHIRELPLCLSDMVSLQVLKFEGNPISFPPKDAFQLQANSPPNESRDTEVTEVAVTAHIKKFLKHYALTGRTDSEAGTGDELSEAKTPRFPLKRAASGRFPIRVNGSDVSELRSPIAPRPPPIPNRSHYRGLSQQGNTVMRRPSGVMPLTIGGNLSERIRSNSETLARPDKPESRNRRMGIVPKKQTSDLGTLDEVEANNRFSHYRGFSMGSAMQSPPSSIKSPTTPIEPALQRPIYVRRLSVLPERRKESAVVFDPVIEAAKGILYSVFQIHPMIQMLMTLTNDGSTEGSSLEPVFYNSNFHVEQLEQEIQKYETASSNGDDYAKDNTAVHSACLTLVGAYGHVCSLLTDNIDAMVNNGDARYIRSLLMLLYNSVMELRATLTSVSANAVQRMPSYEEMGKNSNTIKPYHRDDSGSLTAMVDAAPPPQTRMRAESHVVNGPGLPRSAPEMNGTRRAPPMPLLQTRSGDLRPPAFHRPTPSDPSLSDGRFERIFASLQRSTDVVSQTLPNFSVQLSGGLRNAVQQRAPDVMLREWKSLISMCHETMQRTEMLRSRMGSVQSSDASVKIQSSFWITCSNFVLSWTRTLERIKDAIKTIPLPPDTRGRLRPIHQTVKETSNMIMQSPWHQLFQPAGNSGTLTPSSSGFDNMISPVSTPVTPQSAALGPALQATVPKTPQSASYANTSFASAFQGNVFDRADALLANPGMALSRSGTMSRGHSNLSSMSSISSVSSNDGAATPSTTISPNGEFLNNNPFPLGKIQM